jgi:hypothetical protein
VVIARAASVDTSASEEGSEGSGGSLFAAVTQNDDGKGKVPPSSFSSLLLFDLDGLLLGDGGGGKGGKNKQKGLKISHLKNKVKTFCLHCHFLILFHHPTTQPPALISMVIN